VELRVHVEDPEPPVRLVGLQTTVRPVEGLIEVVRSTVPVKPLWLVTVTVNVPVELGPSGKAANLYVKGADEPLT
jgi:hypothetical protein